MNDPIPQTIREKMVFVMMNAAKAVADAAGLMKWELLDDMKVAATSIAYAAADELKKMEGG